MKSNKKLILSGNTLELFETKLPFFYGYTDNRNITRTRCTDPEKIKENRKKSVWRAKGFIKRLVVCNFGNWFKPNGKPFEVFLMTHTFRANVIDIPWANKEITKYMKNFNYLCFGEKCSKLAYLTVLEFQERGAVHYHTVLFNMPYVKRLYDRAKKLWPHEGTVNFELKKDINQIKNYVAKYVTKSIEDERLRGVRSYFHSQNLLIPEIFRNQTFIESLQPEFPVEHKKFENEFKHEYYESMKYIKYELPYEHPLLPKIKRGLK